MDNWHHIYRKLTPSQIARATGKKRKSTVTNWLKKYHRIPSEHFDAIELLLIENGYSDITASVMHRFNDILNKEHKENHCHEDLLPLKFTG